MTTRDDAGTAIDTVWYTRCPSPTASSIAITGGWLDREFDGSGVQVRSLRASADREVRQTHFTGGHDALFRQGGIVPPLWAAARGTPTRLIGLSEVPRFQAVISMPGSKVERPADLRGARLGLPRRTTEPVDFWRAHSLRGLLAALNVAGLDESDVKWVNLATDAPYHVTDVGSTTASLWTAREASRLQSPEVLALVRGEVDAIYTYAPAGSSVIELLNANVVVSLPSGVPESSGIGTIAALTVSQALLDARPDLVTRYVAALLKAADWAHRHADEAINVFAAEEGVAVEWAAAAFGGPPAIDLRPELSPELLGALQREADFLFERGFLDGLVRVSDWADDGPLRSAEEQVEETRIDQSEKVAPTAQRTAQAGATQTHEEYA